MSQPLEQITKAKKSSQDDLEYYSELDIVLPWLGLGTFNKIDITQGGLV